MTESNHHVHEGADGSVYHECLATGGGMTMGGPAKFCPFCGEAC